MAELGVERILEVCSVSAFGCALGADARDVLERLQPSDEVRLFQVLKEHRLHLLFWDGLVDAGLKSVVSEEGRNVFERLRFEGLLQHAELEVGLHWATSAITRRQKVIVCKGAMLAQHYYPKRGLRRMHDVDLWLVNPKLQWCRQDLMAAGFFERPEKENPGALNFRGAGKVELDVHYEMALFRQLDLEQESRNCSQSGETYRIFRPEPLVAHLVSHMLGHATRTGFLFCWLIDIALVLRSESVDFGRVRQLLRNDGAWAAFLRLLRTFADLGWWKGEVGALRTEIDQARPIDWELLARHRRLASWKGSRGKLRLARALLHGRERAPAPIPRLFDLLWKPSDWWHEENRVTGGQGAMLIRRPKDF